MDATLQQFYDVCDKVEDLVFTHLTVGWQPTSGFDDKGRMEFEPSIDVDRIITRKWPFCSFAGCAGPLLAYLTMCFIGWILLKGSLSKHRGPFVSDSVLYPIKFLYNFIQIYLCSYMTLESIILARRHNYGWFPWTECNVFNFQDSVMANLMWTYYMSKMLDWLDTLFIILGNKPKQFSFLHVYHHASVWLITWLGLMIAYDSENFFTIGFNAFIHVIMYTYYLISMHIPKEKDMMTAKSKYSIWWKQHLTSLQMIQFIAMVSSAVLILYNECYQMAPRYGTVYRGYVTSIFVLFLNFFVRAYCRGNKRKRGKKKTQ